MFSIPLHPRLVHFPIALLVLGALALLWALWRDEDNARRWGQISLLLGWLLTIPALITGLIDKAQLPADSPVAALADRHTTAIFAMWILYGLTLYWHMRWQATLQTRQRWLLMGLLLVATVVLLLAGHWGGQLVYQFGAGVSTP